MSLCSAFLGYWFGLRRFRSERMWERKFTIYVTIFDALNDLAEDVNQDWEEMQRDTPMTDEQKKKFGNLAGAARQLIKKQAHIGAFVLSGGSEKNLAILLDELRVASANDSWIDYLDDRSSAIHKAIDNLKASARADLKT